MPAIAHPIGLIAGPEHGPAALARLTALAGRIIVADPDPRVRAQWASGVARAELAPSLFDLGSECETIVAVVPLVALLAALHGEEDRPGFGPALKAGSIVVHVGPADAGADVTSSPVGSIQTHSPPSCQTPAQQARGLAGLLGAHAIGYVDAPLVAGERAALVCAGGWPEFVSRVQPILRLFGDVVVAGPAAGAGQALAALVIEARIRQRQVVAQAREQGAALGLGDAALAHVLPWPGARGPSG